MSRSLLLAALILLAPAQVAAGPADVAAAKVAMDRANADWLPAMQAGDAARITEPYAADGVFVLPNGQTIVGKPAITDFYRAQLSRGRKILSGALHQDGVSEAAGGLMIEWGHGGSVSVDPAGKQTTSSGPYMTVWKKGPDGRWAIIRNLVF